MDLDTSIRNFKFAFNNMDVCDKILKVEIVVDLAVHNKPEVSEEDTPNLKRRREDVSSETSDEEASQSSIVLQTKTLPINSPILAAKSPFFYKLFLKNDVTLRIEASEVTALIEVLNFMYTNTLTTKALSASDLVNVLKAADKYEVVSCMSYCAELLLHLPITLESALLYLELPSSLNTLIDTAKHFLADRFKDLAKYEKEVLNLPIAGIESVLSSDNLQVLSEDNVFDIVVKWARKNYPNIEERQNIMTTRLCHLIRFPLMSVLKLDSISESEFNNDYIYEKIFNALSYKAEDIYQQCLIEAEAKAKNSHHNFVERAYIVKQIKIIQFEKPFTQTIVYFDLKKEHCANLFPSSKVYSKLFYLGSNRFVLYASCSMNEEGTCHNFELFLHSKDSVIIHFEFGARENATMGLEFEKQLEGICDFSQENEVRDKKLLSVPWNDFFAHNSNYFINGCLYLSVDLIIKE